MWVLVLLPISIGNNMICSDIWHKYHKWYFEIVIRNVTSRLRQFWNIMSGTYAKYHMQIMLLFVYTTSCKRFVIFTCRYFKLSWNTTALSQSNCRNFSCSSIIDFIYSISCIRQFLYTWYPFPNKTSNISQYPTLNLKIAMPPFPCRTFCLYVWFITMYLI